MSWRRQRQPFISAFALGIAIGIIMSSILFAEEREPYEWNWWYPEPATRIARSELIPDRPAPRQASGRFIEFYVLSEAPTQSGRDPQRSNDDQPSSDTQTTIVPEPDQPDSDTHADFVLRIDQTSPDIQSWLVPEPDQSQTDIHPTGVDSTEANDTTTPNEISPGRAETNTASTSRPDPSHRRRPPESSTAKVKSKKANP